MFWQQSQYDSMLRFSSRVFVRVRVMVRVSDRVRVMVRAGVPPPQKERETYGQKERENGDAVLYEKGG